MYWIVNTEFYHHPKLDAEPGHYTLTGHPASNVDMSQAITPPPVGQMPLDVPVMGTAVGGSDGDFSLNGQYVDYVRRPPGIAKNYKVFAVFVQGSSMEPRFDEGSLVYVDPFRPVRSGDDVLIEMQPARAGEPGPAMIKQLVSKTPVRLSVRQFNPAKEITLPGDRVLRVCLILKLADLLGI